jgi:hypothetical protein
MGTLSSSYRMIGDLKQFSEFGDGVDAVIGTDLLRMSQSMRIDFGSKLVTFKFAGESDPQQIRFAGNEHQAQMASSLACLA